MLCKSTLLRMRLAMACVVCYVVSETCRNDFKCFNVKFYVGALVGVIIEVILHKKNFDETNIASVLILQF